MAHIQSVYLTAQQREVIRAALQAYAQAKALELNKWLSDSPTGRMMRADTEEARRLFELLDGADIDIHKTLTD